MALALAITIYYLTVTFYSVSRADGPTLNFIACILYEIGLGPIIFSNIARYMSFN